VIDGSPSKNVLLACGCIELPKGTLAAEYLLKIQSELENLLLKYQPDKVGIESLFVQKNLTTVMTVAQARGVVLYTLAKHGLTWTELSPNTIKATVAGAGNAGKLEVERMVGLLLHIDTAKLLDDTTDALAVALTAQAIKL
jgi:crossover junction endodeoxyribonuclease RuvC